MKQDAGWDALLGRYLSGQMNLEDRRVLNKRLREEPAARRDFAEMLNIDSAMAVAAAGAAECRSAHQRTRSRLLWLGTATAVLLLGMVITWWVLSATNPPPFATVVNVVGADLRNRMALRDEPQKIETGVVEFLTGRGTTVIVEAPASFRFESAQQLRLHHGRVLAVVTPEGKGFTLLTPAGNFVDQGTEFGVEVSRDGTAEVHVYRGEVVAVPRADIPNRSLSGGQSWVMPGDGSPAGPVNSAIENRFINAETLQAMSHRGSRPGSGAAPKSQASSSQAAERTVLGNLGFGGNKGLDGVFYDFKQNAAGNAIAYDPGSYFKRVKAFADSGFQASHMKPYFRAPQQMRLNFLAVPVMDADEGPKAFAVDTCVQPTGWLIHYSGTVHPPAPGEWRFVGYFDDALIVYINNQPVLDASRDELINLDEKTPDPALRQSFGGMSVLNGKCYAGKWTPLTGPVKIDIIVGERPGSQLGGLLMVENKRTKYRLRSNGTPVLPLFVISEPDAADRERMRAFSEANAAFGLELQHVPVFKTASPPR